MSRERRLILQKELEGYLEDYDVVTNPSEHVSFQPNEESRIPYPHIIYEMDPADNTFADNLKYLRFSKYRVTLIDRNPDSPVFYDIEKREYCDHSTSFVQDGLNHFVFDLYY